jgi:hypothetical protein
MCVFITKEFQEALRADARIKTKNFDTKIFYTYSSFNEDVSSFRLYCVKLWDYYWIMNRKEYGRERSCIILTFYPKMSERTKKNHEKPLSRNNQSPGTDLYPELPEYEANALTTLPLDGILNRF